MRPTTRSSGTGQQGVCPQHAQAHPPRGEGIVGTLLDRAAPKATWTLDLAVPLPATVIFKLLSIRPRARRTCGPPRTRLPNASGS
jgi:hypothetical protein